MQKVGYRKISEGIRQDARPLCMSCGGVATKRVIFEDEFCTLKVRLCDECADKDYEELKLRRMIDWPGMA